MYLKAITLELVKLCLLTAILMPISITPKEHETINNVQEFRHFYILSSENFSVPLEEYFSGYNLSYSYSFNESNETNAIILNGGFTIQSSIDIDCDISTTEVKWNDQLASLADKIIIICE